MSEPSPEPDGDAEPSGARMATIAVRGLAHPEALPRILGLLAQRGMVPIQFSGRRDGERLFVDLQIESESQASLDVLLAKLDALVLVEHAWMVANVAGSAAAGG